MKKYLIASIAASLLSAGMAQADIFISILGGTTSDPGLTIGTKESMDSGYNFGARAGYNLDQHLSLDADMFYNDSHIANDLGEHVRSLSGMSDLLYHWNFRFPLDLYGGAGLGIANTHYGYNGDSGSGSVLGWQALAGVEYRLSSTVNLFTEYRYQNAHDIRVGSILVGNTSSNISAGVKFNL